VYSHVFLDVWIHLRSFLSGVCVCVCVCVCSESVRSFVPAGQEAAADQSPLLCLSLVKRRVTAETCFNTHRPVNQCVCVCVGVLPSVGLKKI